jgi:hypothetical protein
MAISEGEKQLLTHLDKLYVEGAEHRAKWSKNWQKAIQTIHGNQWPEKRPKYKINAVMNFLGEIIERKAGLLTDGRPSMLVTSSKQEDDPICEILQKTCEGVFSERSFEQKLTEHVMLEEHFGSSFMNTTFDRNLDYGKGDIDFVTIDPRSFIFDPFVTRSWNLENGEYCCLETIRPTELLRDIHKRPDDIKADFGSQEVRSDSLVYKIRDFFGYGKTGEERTSVIPRSVIRDWWVRDRTTKGKGGEKLFKGQWRHIIIAGGCPVEDGVNPFIDGRLPFDMMEWIFNVDSAYGLNEVDKLEMPQILFNKVLASVVENAILMGNGIWKGDRDALSDKEWDRLSNEPGSQVRVRPGKNLSRETPPALPNYMMSTLSVLQEGMEKLSGITEVTEGRRPGQVTSGVAIESLATMAQTTIRLKARQIEAMIERMGQKLIPRIFQFYTTDRVFNFSGASNGKIQKYTFEREKIRKKIQKDGELSFRDYVFKVVPTSSLAMTKWQKGLMATQLYQMGLIDEKAALDSLEFPNRDEIMKRMSQKQEEQFQLMMAAQQEGQGISQPPQRGFGQKSKGQKMSKNLLRGDTHKETGMQLPEA